MIGKTISHYKILDKVGAGGMGIVYKAEDLRLGRQVALKFLPIEMSEEEKRRKRFIQEAKAASSLDHPNLCTIHEIDQTEEGQMFISMTFYEGITLRQRMDTFPLTMDAAIDFATQIASGLSKAHEHGIIHRDIKPANVIITNTGLVKILDFGLAKLGDTSGITEADVAIGTVAYMSPEQAKGKMVDPRTDIWSWGVVLFEMLTGRLPFVHDHPAQLFSQLFSPEPVEIPEQLPADVRNLLSNALAKDPQHRYPSITQPMHILQTLKSSGHSITRSTYVYGSLQETRGMTKPELILPQGPEKKPLVLMVAAISGYTEMLEQLPHQTVTDFLKNFQDAANRLTAKYHGSINEFSPERIVVLLGVPHAQENDFVSAVQLAFELQDCVKAAAAEFCGPCASEIGLCAAVHSGIVLMTSSTHVSGKFEITGVPYQRALALATNARPNEVVIAQENRRLVRGAYGVNRRDPVQLPGSSKVLAACAVIPAAPALEEQFATPYIGKEKELALLQAHLTNAQEGSGQFIALIGDAGVGKSRLVSEFLKRVPADVRVIHGKCQPYNATLPYAPFRELLQMAFHAHAESSPQLIAENIKRFDPGLTEFIPLYFHLLSLQNDAFPFPKHLEGENLRLAILDALTAFVLSGGGRTVLFVMEDWHWADEASANALKQIVDMIDSQKALILMTYRPGTIADWTGARNPAVLQLDPLEASSSKELICAILDVEEVSRSLSELIQERSGGNPFFIEEICFNLKEENKIKIVENVATFEGSAHTLRLPETIQSLILSRLDRLSRSAREVLQSAAVVGREFPRGIIQQIVSDPGIVAAALTSLRNGGLIQQIRVLPEPAYKFRHALTHEVAYESLLAHEKKHLHEKTAEAVENLYADRLDEYRNILAYHYSRAENWQKAVENGIASAKEASALGQFTEALQILESAEQWVRNIRDAFSNQALWIDVMLQQERLCETLGKRERQQKILDELLDVLFKSGPKDQLIEVHRRRGELLTLLSRFEEAETALNESLHLSRSLQDAANERNAFRSLGFLKWHQGLNDEAIANNRKALAIDRERDDTDAIAADLTNLGSVYREQGDHQAGLEVLQEALTIYEKTNDPVKHAAALHLTANIHREMGNVDRGISLLKQAMDLSTRYRLTIMLSFHLNSLANMSWQQGDFEESLRLHQQAVEMNRKSHYADGLAHALHMAGETLENLQRPLEALPYLQEAVGLFSHLKDQRSEISMLTKIAAIHEAQKAWDSALAALQRLTILSESIKDGKLQTETLERLANASRQKRDLPAALEYYAEAIRLLESGGKKEKLASTLNSIAIVEWKLGQYENALQHYERALIIFRDLDDRVHQAFILNSIGVTCKSMGQFERGLIALQEALELNRIAKQRRLEGHTLSTLAEIYAEMGEKQSALKYYREAQEVKRELGDDNGAAWMLYHSLRLQWAQDRSSITAQALADAEKRIDISKDPKLHGLWNELKQMIQSGGQNAQIHH